MGRFQVRQWIWITIAVGLCILPFQNCAKEYDPNEGAEGLDLGSLGACESEIAAVYKSSFHPFLSTTCKSCHIAGPGKGAFASPDLATSLAAFRLAGPDKVAAMAVNPSHAPGFTGTQNQAKISEIQPLLNTAIQNAPSCKDVGASDEEAALTIPKTIAAPANGTNKTLTWNLDTELAQGAGGYEGAQFKIDVKAVTKSPDQKVYYISNPTLVTKTSAIRVKGIFILFNGARYDLGSTYSQVSTVVQANNTGFKLSTGVMTTEFTAQAADTLSVQFIDLRKNQ